jgi:hypothetical protein
MEVSHTAALQHYPADPSPLKQACCTALRWCGMLHCLLNVLPAHCSMLTCDLAALPLPVCVVVLR